MRVAAPARPREARRPGAVPPSAAASLRAVVRRGLLDHRRSPLTWGGALGAMSALVALMWPSIEGSLGDLLESYPEALKDAFGFQEISSLESFIDAEMLSAVGPGPTRRPRIYACGPTAFVERAADLLVELGHEPTTIRVERFGPTGG